MIRTRMRWIVELIRKHPKIRRILRCESPYFHHCNTTWLLWSVGSWSIFLAHCSSDRSSRKTLSRTTRWWCVCSTPSSTTWSGFMTNRWQSTLKLVRCRSTRTWRRCQAVWSGHRSFVNASRSQWMNSDDLSIRTSHYTGIHLFNLFNFYWF